MPGASSATPTLKRRISEVELTVKDLDETDEEYAQAITSTKLIS